MLSSGANTNNVDGEQLLDQHRSCRAVPVPVPEGAEAAVPAGHDNPVVAGEHREPVASGHPGDRLALQGLDAGRSRPPVLHLSRVRVTSDEM